MSKKLIFVLVLCVFGVFWRLIETPANFSPLTAIGLFAAGLFWKTNKKFVLVPMAVLFVSDIFLGFYEGWYLNYLSLLIAISLGASIFREMKPKRLVLASLGASTTFFVFSNFFVWLGTSLYSKDFMGLISCYASAIPFYRNALAGDLIFASAFLAVYLLIQNRQKTAESLS